MIAERKLRWIRERWPAIRARGRMRFLLVRGLLGWGGPMAVVFGLMTLLRLGAHHPRLPLLLCVDAALCAVGGLLWGATTWWISERLYRSINARNGNTA